ncbi:MAG TPA: hypothetical protein VKV80_21955 [Streptosporangiaceae bacterium]|nr:hypothetical protein [Streptosporangiaceae bacterium]
MLPTGRRAVVNPRRSPRERSAAQGAGHARQGGIDDAERKIKIRFPLVSDHGIRNGTGKTTTMRLIAGLGTPTSGKALVGGRPYASLAAR